MNARDALTVIDVLTDIAEIRRREQHRACLKSARSGNGVHPANKNTADRADYICEQARLARFAIAELIAADVEEITALDEFATSDSLVSHEKYLRAQERRRAALANVEEFQS